MCYGIRVMPDILDARVPAAFDREIRQQMLSAHIGQTWFANATGSPVSSPTTLLRSDGQTDMVELTPALSTRTESA